MNILIIALFYAPSSEVPSVRMISLSNYLITKGYNVSVVSWTRKKLETIYKENELSSVVPPGVKVYEYDSDLRETLPFIDDIRLGKEFTKKISKIVDIKKYDIIIDTCGPYFTLEAMPVLKKRYGIPYVLDFRDLGALNYRPNIVAKSSNKLFQWLKKPVLDCYKKMVYNREKKSVNFADGLVCVSDIDCQEMLKTYKINPQKCIIASNGFDENKLKTIKPINKRDGITCAVFGKFMYYSKERALAILKSIDNLIENEIDVELWHIGRSSQIIDETIKQNNINKKGYKSCGLQEYSVGMSILGAADFFVVEDTSPDDVGTKIYDYIYWNKPIIASVPKNIPLAKLVDTFEHGYVCESEEEIFKAMNDIISNRYNVLDSKLDCMKYSRLYQNQKIEKLITDIVLRRC